MRRRTFLSASLAGAGDMVTAPARAMLGCTGVHSADGPGLAPTRLRDASVQRWEGEEAVYSPAVLGPGD
jgi:hypothetical protein